jgi:hypothetical protein
LEARKEKTIAKRLKKERKELDKLAKELLKMNLLAKLMPVQH